MTEKNFQDAQLRAMAIGYAYFSNGQFILLEKSYKECHRIVKTLADIQKRGIFLYSVNCYGEIYHVRFIRSMYERRINNVR